MKLIDKNKLLEGLKELKQNLSASPIVVIEDVESLVESIEVKEVDEQKERMNECPFRQVGCTMYKGYVLECTGACSWVVDYSKLKELKVQKGE